MNMQVSHSQLTKVMFTSAATLFAVLGITAAAYAFSPDRPTYTVAHPADHVTLDSITDNPREGDERTFFSIADAATPTALSHQATVRDGEEVILRVYVNNDASVDKNGTNLDGDGIAKNTQVRVALPTISGNTLQVSAFVSADNAQPKMVNDSLNTASSSSDEMFSLSYEPGTATLSNNSVGDAGLKLSDDIVKNGTAIGYSKADGNLPAWFQYAGVVTLKAKVHVASAATNSFTVNQSVALPSDTSWAKTITTSPYKQDEQVKFQIGFTNTGTAQLNSVNVSDTLPSGASIVKGSAKLFNATNKNGTAISDDVAVINEGVAVGDYAPNANGYVELTATMPTEDKLQCGENDLTNTSTVGANGTNLTDTTTIKVKKTCAAAAPATTTPAVPAAGAPTDTSKLANTGPGDVLALFALTTVLGTAMRHLYITKRLTRSN
jgi:uncharacterized repeat protein (TIGR01451 family)